MDTPTPEIVPSFTPTVPIQWFPATATWTAIPNLEMTATPVPLPGLGGQIFVDEFDDTSIWTHAKKTSDGGNSIILGRNRLTLAANITPVSLSSLQSGLLLSNFFAEINVSVNRCAGQDVYGVLFRAGSEAYAYRVLLNCAGNIRLERIQDGKTFPLQDWLASGDVPFGAPGETRIGVWASGGEIRIFLNGRIQFTTVDPFFKSGGLGVFIKAASEEGMNVSFSRLVVYSVDYVSPTPTLLPSRTPTTTRTPRPAP